MSSVWDDLAETVPEEINPGRDIHLDQSIDKFAECLSRHGNIAKAARDALLAPAQGQQAFARIRAELGAQAR